MQTKAPPPRLAVSTASLHPVLHAWFEMSQLKHLFRQGWLRAGLPRQQCESVAEHSLGVAFLTLLLADEYVPGVNANRAVRMALLHDLGEARVGDLTPHDGVASSDKHQRERDAVREILSGLPRSADYLALWEDYEAGASAEARLVKQADRLEMALQATVYRAQAGLSVEDFFNSARAAIRDPQLQALLAELESPSERRG